MFIRGSGRAAWHGHGVLMQQRPDEAHAIWIFWDGPEREFRGWYVNLQEPLRRTAVGYDTQDLELGRISSSTSGSRPRGAGSGRMRTCSSSGTSL
jgi:hypothetical protein